MRFSEHEVLAHNHLRSERFPLRHLPLRFNGVYGWTWRMIADAEAIAHTGGDGQRLGYSHPDYASEPEHDLWALCLRCGARGHHGRDCPLKERLT